MAKTSSWKYTLREIIIVIIGITIAFSMNKCAESRSNTKLKEQYLTNLKSDIEADRLQLENNIEAIDKKIKVCEQIIPVLNTNSQQGMSLLTNVFEIVEYENFNSKKTTYLTLVNSGDLKLIEDFELKTAIQQHYSNYEEMADDYIRHTSLIQDYLGNYLVNNADYDQMNQGNSPFLDEIKLKNIVRALLQSFVDKRTATQEGVKSCDNVLETLGEALN
ncbi:DUF6090 family protein [Winogradskyella maritima]|uniref:DUF6090 family protein n=1 Tax=Winogradskyella maritima TaxID=1517766 RepID=A0ABV8AH46_9FLAO|nr:DUF6090 family protein [Winogradskyella maritima]